MTNAKITMAAFVALAAVLGACQSVSATSEGGVQQGARAASAGEVLDVRAAMVEGVNPAALAIWDFGNNMMTDEGQLDPALMDAAAWARLHEASQSLADYAGRMARAEVIRASGPDLVGGEVPEGVSSREEIQAMIDANPDGFRALSTEMGRQADAIAAAAKTRDLVAASDQVLAFDGACQACHENYWYPQQ